MEYLDDEEEKVYANICNYNQSFSYEELVEFENEIFGSLSKIQRVVKEFTRLKNLLMQKADLYAKYIGEIVDIENKLKVIEFDPTLLKEISLKVVNIQMKLGMDVRLLSCFPKLQKEYEYMNFTRLNKKREKVYKVN